MEIVYNTDLSYLEHHGIKGQKWGVRRFQNVDGTYTEAGRKRYDIGKPRESSNQSSIALRGNAGSGGVSGFIKKRQNEMQEYQAKHIQEEKSRTDRFDQSKESNLDVLHNTSKMTRIMKNVITGNFVDLGVMAVKAIGGQATASVKTNKVTKANESGEVDKKTGFHKKQDREYTRKEDMKSVNPGFKNLNANTKNNCMLCTMTYDLRKRGYAVSANTGMSGYYSDDIKRWYPKAKVQTVKNTDADGKKSRSALVKNTIDELEKMGPGARGNLAVMFSSSKLFDVPAGGHSMAFEISPQGKLEILDCQTNKVYSNPQSILSRCMNVDYSRLDNVDLDLTHISEVAH